MRRLVFVGLLLAIAWWAAALWCLADAARGFSKHASGFLWLGSDLEWVAVRWLVGEALACASPGFICAAVAFTVWVKLTPEQRRRSDEDLMSSKTPTTTSR